VNGPKSRRRALAVLGAGAAAAFGGLFAREARAADGDPVILGQDNQATTGTGLDADTDKFAFAVANSNTGQQTGAVRGESPAGHGLEGESQSGRGVSAHSETGVGGFFSTDSGQALQTIGYAAVGASNDNFALHVDNLAGSAAAGGILSTNHGGGKPAIEADALPGAFGPGVGVQGVSGGGTTFGQGPGVGVQGISGSGVGVEAICVGDGAALRVSGKAKFSTAGSAVVPAGAESVFVANAAVTSASHISVTLTGDPGARSVRWVQRSPGSGFTVYLTSQPPKQRPATPFTYLTVEPA
jgi:hypothetical protein